MQVRMCTTTCTHTCAHAHRHRLHFWDVRTHHCQSFSSVLLWKERKSLIRRGITSTVFHCNWFIPVCLPQCVWKTYGLLWSEVEGIFLIERKGIFRLHLKLSWRFMHLYDGSFISLYIFCVHFITWCKTNSAIFTSNISIIDHESFLCAVIQCLQSIFCYIVLLMLGFGCHNQEETEVTGDINLAERFWWWTRWNQRKLNTLANWGCFFFIFFLACCVIGGTKARFQPAHVLGQTQSLKYLYLRRSAKDGIVIDPSLCLSACVYMALRIESCI